MDNPFNNVKDSTIWFRPGDLSILGDSDSRLYIGVIRSVFNEEETHELRYLVEVYHRTDIVLTTCRMMRQLGGVYNYQDFVMHDYNFNADSSNGGGLAAKAGDVVLVGSFAGQSREGVILGGLTHPARTSFLDATKGPAYCSEFNGVETSINPDGEYRLTFKGQPTNLAKLADAPQGTVAAPEYDTKIGSSYLLFDKAGSFTVNDNAEENPQRFFIDKEKGELYLESGKVSLKFKKEDESVSLAAKITKIDSTDSITINTKKSELNADDKARIKAPNIYIVGTTFLGADQLITSGVPNDGVVTGMGIDTLTGAPYSALGNASTVVFAKK